MKITRKTKLTKIVKLYPELAEILTSEYGLHCLGCFAAAFESLEDGAKAHGFKSKDVDKMIEKLNATLEAKN